MPENGKGKLNWVLKKGCKVMFELIDLHPAYTKNSQNTTITSWAIDFDRHFTKEHI